MRAINKINRCIVLALSFGVSFAGFAMEKSQKDWDNQGTFLTTLSHLGFEGVQVQYMKNDNGNYYFSFSDAARAWTFSEFLSEEINIKGNSGQKWVKQHYPQISKTFGVVLVAHNIEALKAYLGKENGYEKNYQLLKIKYEKIYEKYEEYLIIVDNLSLLEKVYEKNYQNIKIAYEKNSKIFYFSFNFLAYAHKFNAHLLQEPSIGKEKEIETIDSGAKYRISLSNEEINNLFKINKGDLALERERRANKS